MCHDIWSWCESSTASCRLVVPVFVITVDVAVASADRQRESVGNVACEQVPWPSSQTLSRSLPVFPRPNPVGRYIDADYLNQLAKDWN